MAKHQYLIHAMDQNCINIFILIAIDCKWGEWSSWSECDAEYGDGNKHSQRMHLVPAMFGGQECEGDSDQTKACNNLLECRQRVQQQAHEINRLENLLENRV